MKNEQLQKLIGELKKASIDNKVKIWKRIATDLEKSTRRRRVVNLFRINLYSKEGETVVVPGKVLGSGDLNKKLVIAAFDASEQAAEKIRSSGSTLLSLKELIQKNPKGSKVRIIG
ncbi:50S ribosomal protein L18e [Candidatus Woesearchaeota archaeon]|nr:MAG: 50S ribosomal protein L18e [Candidatus Woesearchaeota archaeon]